MTKSVIEDALDAVDCRKHNIAPSKWGPKFWYFIHTTSTRYNPNKTEKRAWRSFINVFLPHYLPCEVCRKHYAKKLKRTDLDEVLQSRKSLVLWFKNFHDEVTNFKRKHHIRKLKLKNPDVKIKPYKRYAYSPLSFVKRYICDVKRRQL